MTGNIIKTLLISLFAYQCFVAVPHDLMVEGCFTGDDHYAAWYGFPELRLGALEECTAPGTSIGCFGRPLQDRSMALWNSTFSNKVWVWDSFDPEAEVHFGTDYIYLRPGNNSKLELDKKAIRWCENHPNRVRFIYSDGWGRFYEVIE